MFSRKSKSPKNNIINNNNLRSGKSSRKSDSTATSGSLTTTDCNESDTDSIPSLSMLPSLVTVPSVIPPSIIVGSNRNSIISSATVTLKPKHKNVDEGSSSPTLVKVKTTRSAIPPSDLGSYRTIVSGWDSVDSSGNRLTPKPSSVSPSLISSFTNVTSEAMNKAAMDTSSMSVSSMPSSSPIPNQSLASNVTAKSAKESFFLSANDYQDGVGFSLNKGLRTPTTPTSVSNTFPSSSFGTYRCANMDRLSLRPGIYDLSVPSPEAAQAYTNFLNSEGTRKFTPFTPRDTNAPVTNGTSPNNANPVSGYLKPVPKSLESTNNSSIPTSVMSSIPTSIKEPANYLLSKSREMTERAREDLTAAVEGRKERSASLVRDTDVIVGFSDLPNQIHRKTVKKGFEFTLMVAGKSGLGKSTLINSMFLTDIYSDEYPGPSKRATQTIAVETTKVLLKEKNVNLQLTVVDTPGYGSGVDNSDCWEPIVKHIESQYEEYLNAETKLHRKHIPDSRVHCCLYFIQPSGHTLEELDIQFMKNLHDKVNIIPVIGKADTLTPEELTAFKKNVMNAISINKIKIYDFPDEDGPTDLINGSANASILESKTLKQLKSRIPFAVVGSNCIVENPDGQRKRGRRYPWGIVEVENLEHSDFVALRNLLIRTYMLDLLDTTNTIHYENYRCRKLSGIGGDEKLVSANKDSNKNPLAQMEEEKKEHEMKMKKMENEMEQVFESKVREKMHKLKDSENDLQRKYEQMNITLELQRKELEQKRELYEKERAAFEMISMEMDEIRRASTLEANSRENLDPKKKKKGLF